MPSPDGPLTLDFTSGGVLPPEHMRRLNELSVGLRPEFNAMIDQISACYPRDIDWWVSLPAGRNTHNSELFGKCIQLALAGALHAAGHAVAVRTDSKAQAAVLRGAGVAVSLVAGRPRWRTALHHIASSLFHAFSARRAARATHKLARPVPDGAAVVETYLQQDSVGPEGFQDRYYPGFQEALEPDRQARLFYLPVFHRIRDYPVLFAQLRRAPQNFLLREDHLTLGDYAFAFGHWLRAGKLKGMRAQFAGFHVGAILDAELDKGRFANSALQALLIYRFWRYRAPMRNATLLDWYEGHDLDHAAAAAINWHGQGTRLVAMRPLAPDSYLSLTPTPGEIHAGVVPSRWLVVGQARQAQFAAQFPSLAIEPAPGLRHRPLLGSMSKLAAADHPCVLVLLSLELHLVKLVADMVTQVSCATPGTRWLVKRHPGLPRERAEAFFRQAQNVSFVDGSFADALAQADIVAGLGTNTLIEAGAMGVPAICISGGNLPAELPFTTDDTVWWRTAYDADGLVAAVREAAKAPSVRSPEMLDRFLGPFDPAVLRDIILP